MKGPFGCSEEAALLVGDIEPEVAAADDVPSSCKFLVHILFDFFCHLLLIGPILESVVDDMFSLELYLGLHL